MSETPEPRRCRKCGAELGPSMQGSHCPACLFSLATEPMAPPPAAGTALRYIGDYELLEEVGRGGMGVVYRARQRSLNRILAVKMLLHGEFSEEQARERFRREAQAAARLRHPHIVPIHELGEHEGLLYFSMDYIPGQSMAQALKAGSWSPQRIATCLRTVAEAVHAAHLGGVLHRDLKPANILLDASDRPHLTDFGLAKLLDCEPRLTGSNDVLGTPAYMSPEQADLGTANLTTATDIYSLGAILYHMLAGQPPHSGPTRMAVLRKVIEGKIEPLTTFNPAAPPELVALCLTCLSRNPEARPASCQIVADELERWLAPAQSAPAARPTRPSLVAAWRLPRWLGTIGAISLVAGVVGLGWWRFCQTSPPVPTRAGQGILRQAAAEFQVGRPHEAMALLINELDTHRTNALVAERLMSALMYRAWPRLLEEPISVGHDLALSQTDPDAKWLLVADNAGKVQLWDLATRQKARELLTGTGGGIISLSFGCDNRYLVVRTATNVSAWTLKENQPVGSFTSPVPMQSAVLPVPGNGLAFATCSNHQLRLWNLKTGREIAEPEARRTLSRLPASLWQNCDSIELTPDAHRAVVVTGDRRALLLDLTGRDPQPLGTSDTIVSRAVLDAAGNQVWIQDRQHRLTVWDAISGKLIAPPLTLEGEIARIAFSPDGEHAVTWIENQPVCLWHARTGRVVAKLELERRANLAFLAFSPDGQRLLTAETSGALRVWWTRTGTPATETFWACPGLLNASFVNGSETVLTLDSAGFLSFWNVRALTAMPLRWQADSGACDLSFTDDGKALCAGSSAWEVVSGRPISSPSVTNCPMVKAAPASFSAPDGSHTLAISQGSHRALCMPANGELRLWDTREIAPLGEPLRTHWPIKSAALAPDGRKLAALTDKGEIWLWTLPPLVSRAPDWLLTLAAASTNGRAWLPLKAKRSERSGLDSLDVWARWYFAEPARRSLAPGVTQTVPEKLAGLVRETDLESLEEAARIAPNCADTWARLAQAIYRQNPAQRQRSVREALFFANRAAAMQPADLELRRLQEELEDETRR